MNSERDKDFHQTARPEDVYEVEYDDQECAVFFVEDGERCSEFFSFEEYFSDNSYLLVNMFVPEQRKGLGREALECFIFHTGGKVHVRDRWMSSSSDGSHVLPEAWGFVEKMMAEGLIVKHDTDDDDYCGDDPWQ